VNVTGSNIKRTDTETAAPIETITREDILASGLTTISDVVRQITANNNGSISPSFFNGFAASASGVSLRGLGASNTLVLLNGRRLANFGLADDGHVSFVDLQQIPFDAVERIEILKDGASAIYGADAVAAWSTSSFASSSPALLPWHRQAPRPMAKATNGARRSPAAWATSHGIAITHS
jgi:iron complex outermembrane receptor protein